MTTMISDSPARKRTRMAPRERSADRGAVHGRGPERKLIEDLLQRAARGLGGVALVQGEPGIGKSLLLRVCTDSAAEQGFSLAEGTADNLGQAIPFFALRAALREPFARPAADAPGPGLPDPTGWSITRIRSHLERRAESAPVLVCLDDLHCESQATLAALAALPGS